MKRLTCSVNEAARMLGVSRATIYNWMGEGILRSTKVGARRLIPIAAVHELVAPKPSAPAKGIAPIQTYNGITVAEACRRLGID